MPSKPSDIIVGIDPGTRITGYAVIRVSAKIEVIDYGCIRPSAQLELAKRYLFLFNAIEQLLDLHTPQAVSIETQFVDKNVQSALKLGGAKASIFIAAAKREISIFEYTPRKAKLCVTGDGSASKYDVQKRIQLLLELPELPEPEDAADALALAICHAQNRVVRNM